MRTLVIFAVVCVAVAVAVPAGQTYTARWDGVDLDSILHSDRLLKNYVNCLLEKGRCTPDGNDLKKILPDALATDCVKCTDAQRKGSDRVVRYLIKNKPDWWTPLEKKYDPTGEYVSRHPEVKEASQ